MSWSRLFLLSVVLLAACGQVGPLYLPDDVPATPEAGPTPPATEAPADTAPPGLGTPPSASATPAPTAEASPSPSP